jgi:hypothetical protein
MPFLHLVHGREIINSGSVGMPYGHPDVTAWTDDFLHARASDAEAIRIFGPHDGR